MPIEKTSDLTFKVTTQAEAPAPVEQEFDYDFLVTQRSNIIKDANTYLAARQKELDQVNDLIAQADVAGIGPSKMPEPISDPIQPIGGDKQIGA